MCELGEDDETNGKERSAARYRGIDHGQHPIGIRAHRAPVKRVR
jgi:hypothetical protein